MIHSLYYGVHGIIAWRFVSLKNYDWDWTPNIYNPIIIKSSTYCQNRRTRTIMSVQSKIKIIFGTASFGRNSADINQEYLDLLARYNVVDLDTAFLYVGIPHMCISLKDQYWCRMLLHGNTTARQWESARSTRRTVQVHHPYKGPRIQTRARQERIHSQLRRPEHEGSEDGECMFRLFFLLSNAATDRKKEWQWIDVMQVETYYLHSPDPIVPLKETLDAIQEVYKDKRFKKVRATLTWIVHSPMLKYDSSDSPTSSRSKSVRSTTIAAQKAMSYHPYSKAAIIQ